MSKVKEDDTVYIGKKDTMVYVKSCLHVFRNNSNCAIKARYRNILKAIEVYLHVRRLVDIDHTMQVAIDVWEEETEKDGRKFFSTELMIVMMKRIQISNNHKKVKKDE